MVGKYTGLTDSYLSVIKALQHASIDCSRKLLLDWVAAEDLEGPDTTSEVYRSAWEVVKAADGILVPGGFGDRGILGKMSAVQYAREQGVPFLGICLGMQVAVIEYARNVLGLSQANSTEFDPSTPHPCVVFMPEVSKTHMGGTMRLGLRATLLSNAECLTAKLYGGNLKVEERHRHRFEVNPDMVERLEQAGLKFVGRDESGQRMEVVEIADHPYFVAVQFHPEFKSRPGRPSPAFLGLILGASGQLKKYLADL